MQQFPSLNYLREMKQNYELRYYSIEGQDGPSAPTRGSEKKDSRYTNRIARLGDGSTAGEWGKT